VADRPPIPDLLTLEEAGEWMRCSAVTVRRLIRAGELGHVLHARRRWTTPHYIDRYFERRSVDGCEDDGNRPATAATSGSSSGEAPETGTSFGATDRDGASAARLARPIFKRRS
jgi:hypothetical protein